MYQRCIAFIILIVILVLSRSPNRPRKNVHFTLQAKFATSNVSLGLYVPLYIHLIIKESLP